MNSSYAPDLLADLGDGMAAHTHAPYWPNYAAASSELVRERLRLGGARLAAVLNALYLPQVLSNDMGVEL